MVCRQRQRQEGLHRPIGRAGGIVAFADQEIGIGVADRQHAVAVEDRLARPPAEIAQVVALDLPPGQRLDAGIGERAPEAGMGEAVGQAAAEGQGRSVGRVPVPDRAGRMRRRARGSAAARSVSPEKHGIDQPVEVEGEGDVVVGAADRPVAIPAIAEREAFEVVEIGLALCRVDCRRRNASGRDRSAPGRISSCCRRIRARAPRSDRRRRAVLAASSSGSHKSGRARRRAKPMAASSTWRWSMPVIVAPIVGMVGIGAGAQALAIELPMGEVAAAGDERRDPPQRAGEAFEIGRRPVEMCRRRR